MKCSTSSWIIHMYTWHKMHITYHECCLTHILIADIESFHWSIIHRRMKIMLQLLKPSSKCLKPMMSCQIVSHFENWYGQCFCLGALRLVSNLQNTWPVIFNTCMIWKHDVLSVSHYHCSRILQTLILSLPLWSAEESNVWSVWWGRSEEWCARWDWEIRSLDWRIYIPWWCWSCLHRVLWWRQSIQR